MTQGIAAEEKTFKKGEVIYRQGAEEVKVIQPKKQLAGVIISVIVVAALA